MLRIWDSIIGSGCDRSPSGTKREGREANGIGAGKAAIARTTCEKIRNECMSRRWGKPQ